MSNTIQAVITSQIAERINVMTALIGWNPDLEQIFKTIEKQIVGDVKTITVIDGSKIVTMARNPLNKTQIQYYNRTPLKLRNVGEI
jgi:hypothetical protein